MQPVPSQVEGSFNSTKFVVLSLDRVRCMNAKKMLLTKTEVEI